MRAGLGPARIALKICPVADLFSALLGIGILVGMLASPFLVIKWLRGVDRRAAEKNQVRLAGEVQRTQAGVPGRPERGYFKSCTNCGVFGLTLPFRDRIGRTYCSAACMKWLGDGPRDFCRKCAFESTAESSGNLQRLNGIGTTFVGSSDACGECASVVRRVWFTVLYIPLIPLTRYRVLQVSPQQFYSRRLRPLG